jgi:hypothetical protein
MFSVSTTFCSLIRIAEAALEARLMTTTSTIAGQVFERLLNDLKSNQFGPGE